MSESETEDSATAPNTPRIIESPVPSDTSMEPIFAIPVEDNLSENESDERNEGNLKEDKEQAGDVTESISCRNETKVTTESTKDTPTTERKTIETSEENQDIHEMNREKVDSTTTTNTDTATTTINPLTTTECEVSSTVSTDPSIKYNPHITYTEDGIAIYTDPKTHHKYKWDTSQNKWIYWMSDTGQSSGNTVDSTTTTTAAESNLYETEHYKWCPEKKEWMLKEASVQTETEHYKWDAEKKAWIPKVQAQHDAAVTYGIDADGQRIYTDKDGVVFFWDATKNAWFPKIDDDFMARYQMSYGFIDNTSAAEEANKLKEEEEEKRKAAELQRMTEEARAATEKAAKGEADDTTVKRKVTQQPPTWFELNPEQNTKVYVWNLPLDITLDEFAEIMSKCGMIMRDPQTQTYKLKLYTEADGQIKGDGLCDYIKVESVELALKILDEYEVRGHKIRVQRAKFQMRGEYNPALKPKRKKKDKEKLQKMKEKLFDWRPEKMRGERSKNEKVVIIKNLFTPEIFEKEVQLILDYQNDLREECSKCGTVRKVVIYDLHPEGVAQINMSCPEEADVVIKMMHGRYFGQRRLTAEHWDGKTKYKITETETAFKGRLNNWDKFLDTESDKKPATNSETIAETTAVATEQLTAEH